MSDAHGDELTRLRARAYGADADIHRDPGALARLRELEERPTPERPAPEQPAAQPTPEQPAAREDPARAHRRSGRWFLPAVAAGAAAVAVAVTIPVTLWSVGLDDQPFATLAHVDAAAPTVYFSPESRAQRYEDFYGIRVSVGFDDGRAMQCVLLEFDPRPNAEVDPGPTTSGCSYAGFAASVDVRVVDIERYVGDDGRDALERVRSLRFVAAGDEVQVFASASSPTEEEGADVD